MNVHLWPPWLRVQRPIRSTLETRWDRTGGDLLPNLTPRRALENDGFVDKDTVTQKIRDRLRSGQLPRHIPTLMREPGRPFSPSANIYQDSSIRAARCAGCDEQEAQIAHQFPDGQILRFHGRCHRIWEEECERDSRGPA